MVAEVLKRSWAHGFLGDEEQPLTRGRDNTGKVIRAPAAFLGLGLL